MTIQASQIRQWIAGGENTGVEFKERPIAEPRLARECAALANAGGGVLLIGVRDDGSIAGTDLSLKTLRQLRAGICYYIRPELMLDAAMVEVDGAQVAVLRSRPPLSPPYEVELDGAWTCPVRDGEATVEAGDQGRRALATAPDGAPAPSLPKELARYLEQHDRITVKDYATLRNWSERRARRELISLTTAGALSTWRQGPHDYYVPRGATPP